MNPNYLVVSTTVKVKDEILPVKVYYLTETGLDELRKVSKIKTLSHYFSDQDIRTLLWLFRDELIEKLASAILDAMSLRIGSQIGEVLGRYDGQFYRMARKVWDELEEQGKIRHRGQGWWVLKEQNLGGE